MLSFLHSRFFRPGSPWPTLAAILAVGALIRTVQLGRESLMFDELYVVMIDKLPLTGMIREAFAASHLPLYHLVMRAWLLAGDGEVWIRFLSVAAGMGTIALAFLVGRDLFSQRTGLWSAALVAASPFLVWYSRAVTFYSFMIALAMLSFYLLIRAMDRGGWMNWASYVAASLALYMTYFYAAVFTLAVFIFYWLARERTPKNRSGLALFLASQAVIFSASLPVFLSSRLAITEPTKRLTFGLSELRTALTGIAVSPFALVGGWLEPVVNYSGRGSLPVYHLLGAALLVLAGSSLLLWRRFRVEIDRKLLALAGFTFLLVAGPLVLQVANQGRMSGRLYVWAVPFALICAAALLTRFPARAVTVLLAAGVAGLMCLSIWQLARPPLRDADWRRIMGDVSAQWQQGDRLACFPLHNCTLAADYYLPQARDIAGGMPAGLSQGVFFMEPGSRWTGYRTGYWAEYGVTPPLEGPELMARVGSDLSGSERIWLITQTGLMDQQPEIREVLESSWEQASYTGYGYFELMLFKPPRGGS